MLVFAGDIWQGLWAEMVCVLASFLPGLFRALWLQWRHRVWGIPCAHAQEVAPRPRVVWMFKIESKPETMFFKLSARTTPLQSPWQECCRGCVRQQRKCMHCPNAAIAMGDNLQRVGLQNNFGSQHTCLDAASVEFVASKCLLLTMCTVVIH